MNIGFKDTSQRPLPNDSAKVPKIEFPKNQDGIDSDKPDLGGKLGDFPESKEPTISDLKRDGVAVPKIEVPEHDKRIPEKTLDNNNDGVNSKDFLGVKKHHVPDLLKQFDKEIKVNGLTAEQRDRIKNELELPDDLDRIVDRFNNYEQYEKFVDDINTNEDNWALDEDDLDEKGWQYDDNGEPYAYDGVLLPNSEYDLNGYHYKTDSNGRIVEVSGTLKPKTHDGRKPLNAKMDDIAWGDQREDDDRGHLIADQFDGSNDAGNLTAQNKDINRKEVKDFEQQLAKEVAAGKKVEVKITVVYEGDSNRPSAYIYDCKIDGKPVKKIFKNEASGK